MKKTLKTMALLLCAVAMLMTSSCTKENGNQESNDYQSRILGKWKFTRITWYYDSSEELIWSEVIFTSNRSTRYYYDESGELYMTEEHPHDWEYDLNFKTESLVLTSWNIGQKLVDDDYFMFSYIIDDNELNIGGEIFNISELTNSKLVLKQSRSKYEFIKVN
ncbi:MAG: hypothetical protein IKH44_11310 [Bacteroidales bacterium]|nr:hypothetical protein [Bacteroidales bacterium]